MKLDNLNIGTLDFAKAGGLVTAVAQNFRTKEILMVAYQDEKAVQKTIETGEMWFYSRSRQKLWRKGETSGNFQKVFEVLVDCDRDAIVYQVETSGPACHTGERTCFGEGDFDLAHLEEIIKSREANPVQGSYTNELLTNGNLLLAKIREEAGEVVQAVEKKEGKDQIIWETADVLYHLLVLLVGQKVRYEEVLSELEKRRISPD